MCGIIISHLWRLDHLFLCLIFCGVIVLYTSQFHDHHCSPVERMEDHCNQSSSLPLAIPDSNIRTHKKNNNRYGLGSMLRSHYLMWRCRQLYDYAASQSPRIINLQKIIVGLVSNEIYWELMNKTIINGSIIKPGAFGLLAIKYCKCMRLLC